MGNESLQIPMSMFWFPTSPSSFYQNFGSPNILFAPSKYRLYIDLPGQHGVNVSINRETSSCERHRNLSPAAFGICNKLLKVDHGTGTNSQIFRPCDRFDSSDPFFNRRENERSFTGMQNNVFNKRDNSFSVNTFIRSSIIHHKSSSFSSDSVSSPTPSTSVSPERNVLQRKNYFKRLDTGRIAVADRKPKII